jgi:DNA repair exonuclease SbcCD ATPase subunit
LIKDLNNLKLAHSQLLKQKEELEDKSKEMRQQVESLKEANRDLQSQVERLGERLAPPTATGGIKEENSTAKQSPVKPDTVQPENRTGSDPCDALVEYMHKVESILRYAPKQERSQRLEQLEQEYRDRMEALPKAARTDVQAYVSEFVREWDSPGDDTVYNLIKKRDDALKACGKEPTKAGF